MRGEDKTQRVLEAVFRTLLRYHASNKVKRTVFNGQYLSQDDNDIILSTINIGTSGSAPGSPGS